jgi:hypothetical protein
MTATTTRTVEHPSWCWPHQCTARIDGDGYLVGFHRRYLDGFATIYGPTVALYLVDEAKFNGTKAVNVGMVILAHEDDVPVELRDTADERDWRTDNGEWIEFEPEEAQMLGRFLSRAAREWEQAQQQD